MSDEEVEKMRKMLAKESHIMSTSIDFDQLIEDGLLKKIGESNSNIKGDVGAESV